MKTLALIACALQESAPSDTPETGPWWTFNFEGPVLLAGLIVVGSFFAAKLVDFFVIRIVRKLASRTRTSLDNQVLDSLSGPIMKSVVLAGLWLACDVLEREAGSVGWVHGTILTLGVLVWLGATLRLSALLLRAAAHPNTRFRVVEERTLPLFDNVAKIAIVVFAGYLLIAIWKLDATAWLASAGVAGIAIGFAAKDTLANLFSGVFIIADAPYQIGDYIVLDSGYRGRVQHIGLRSSRILTRDDVEITIPNSIIANGAIVNETSGTPQFRVRVKVGVAYGSDLDQVREVLLAAVDGISDVLTHPEPRVRFRGFGDSALDFELLVWIQDPETRGRALDALNTSVYKKFSAAGIEIAFPQSDLHLRSVPKDWLK